jgi:hypothetical protein
MEEILKKHINDLTKEDWDYLYNTKGMTLSDLSKNYGVCIKTISVRLGNVGIKRRSAGREFIPVINEEELKDLYLIQDMSIEKIALIKGIKSATIRLHLKKYGIPFKIDKTVSILTYDFLFEEYVNNGKNATQIAKETGISAGAVNLYLRKNGFEVSMGVRSQLTEELEKSIVDKYVDGSPVTNISKILGVSLSSIYTALAKNGINMRDNNSYIRKLPADDIVINDYCNLGLSLGQIGDKYKVSKSAVNMLLKRKGISLRSKSESKAGVRNNMFNIHHTKGAKEKMSNAYGNDVRKVNYTEVRGNTESVRTPLQGRVNVRSSWEGAVCRYFNNLGVKYLYEPKALKVVVDGGNTTYTPDFLVISGLGEKEFYLEVKGVWKEDSHKKVDYLINQGYPLEVWEGKDLIEKGILSNSFRPLY